MTTEAKTITEKLIESASRLDRAKMDFSSYIATQAAEEIARLQAQVKELADALDHAVCIAEDRMPGTWDDLLQYRAALAKVGR